jgi:PTS system mannose-specific IID component
MTGKLRSFLRLLAVQGSWNYERMLGVGMGYAAEPLLKDLETSDPTRHAEAVVRSAEFFNCHPYLAGLALGATVKAEYEAVPGAQVARLRTALCSPLGALGDQFFWSGLLPALMGAALASIALGAGLWGILGFLLVYNAVRFLTGYWSLKTGLTAGMNVGRRISDSWLPVAARVGGLVAGLLVGMAIPIVTRWTLAWADRTQAIAALLVGIVGVVLSYWFRHSVTAVRFALALLVLTVLWRWTIS